jgi:hypothetical protein
MAERRILMSIVVDVRREALERLLSVKLARLEAAYKRGHGVDSAFQSVLRVAGMLASLGGECPMDIVGPSDCSNI